MKKGLEIFIAILILEIITIFGNAQATIYSRLAILGLAGLACGMLAGKEDKEEKARQR